MRPNALRARASVVCVIYSAAAISGCASDYTIVNRGDIQPSAATRLSAQNLAPPAAHNTLVAEHLAIAAEVYERQLALLKRRRNEVRARRRTFNQLAIGSLVATVAGVAMTSLLLSDKSSAADGLRAAGVASLSGIVLGSTLETVGLMQEEPEAIEAKIRKIDDDYGTMLARLRSLEPEEGSNEASTKQHDEALRVRAGAIIEEFISSALAISIKG